VDNFSTTAGTVTVGPLAVAPAQPVLPSGHSSVASHRQRLAGRLSPAAQQHLFSWLASLLVHFCAVMAIALVGSKVQPFGSPLGIVAAWDDDELLPVEDALVLAQLAVERAVVASLSADGAAQQEEDAAWAQSLEPSLATAQQSEPVAQLESSDHRNTQRLLEPLETAIGGGLEGRSAEARAALVRRRGGTAESEAAVERGLRWLIAHQCNDGSWSFDHNRSLCRGACRNPGKHPSSVAATALAVLPFLGAGYTHRQGPYQDQLDRALYYLKGKGVKHPHGLDFQDGTMYAHALATIALCEAYAMTGDTELKSFAQQAINFAVYAQDLKGGGWRYVPGEPGDTTVTGWMLMALKSGQMAGLDVPSPTIFAVQRFLDSVQCDDGAQYGYQTPQPRQTTTAIGLLMRMYLGWGRRHPALQRGAALLADWGIQPDNMYYNYYAAQVLAHIDGPAWTRWNAAMRDHLIATQATHGHEAGSWYFAGGHGDVGGRVYNTAMAVMILEVYYRYMPLYRPAAVNTGF